MKNSTIHPEFHKLQWELRLWTSFSSPLTDSMTFPSHKSLRCLMCLLEGISRDTEGGRMAQIKPGCRPFHECNPTFFCTTTVLVSRERFEWRNKEQLGDMSVHAFHSQDANQILSHTDTSLHLLTEQTFSTVVLIAVGSNLLQIQELGHLSLSSPPILQPISLPHIY